MPISFRNRPIARRRIALAVSGSLLIAFSLLAARPYGAAAAHVTQPAPREGVHDFDWDIGTWKIHQRRLLHPLSGSTTWVQYEGTDTVQKIWTGANMGKVETHGPAGRLEFYTLRLYNPRTHEWSIYFANKVIGALSVPVVGRFDSARRGEFYDNETYEGRAIAVRFRVREITARTCVFNQSFSADGGKTWEPNLVVDETLSSARAS